METVNRRTLLKTGGLVSATSVISSGLISSGLMSSGLAHEPVATTGAWSPLSSMPFPVQEIYPAAFWRDSIDAASPKPKPFNVIVTAGGLTPNYDHQVTDRVDYYDPRYDAWGTGTSLPAPRHHLALVNNNGYLYAIGGFARNEGGGWQMSDTLWSIDALNGSWLEHRPLPYPRAEAVCASLAGYIHVAGGRAPSGSQNANWNDHIDTAGHWLYDPRADLWHQLAPLQKARNSAAGAILNGIFYVIGGRTVQDGNTNVVEVYDSLSDRWSYVQPLPQAQGGLAASVVNGKIYAFGGEYFSPHPGGVHGQCWEYDPAADTWRGVAAMPRARHGLGAVAINDTIYAMGGAHGVGGRETTSDLYRFEI